MKHIFTTTSLLVIGCAVGALSVGAQEAIQADIDYLVGCLESRDLTIRKDAVEDLGRIGEEAIDEVAALLGAKDLRTRTAAAEALGAIGGAGTVEPLLAALQDSHYRVVGAAAAALAETEEPRAVAPLIELAGNGKGHRVRMAACEALGKLGDTRAVRPMLQVMRHDPHPLCEPLAVEALQAITGKDFGYDANAWAAWVRAEHPDWLELEKKPLHPRSVKLVRTTMVILLGGVVVVGWLWRNL